MKNFILIGAAGYIAPRHMQAIKATGNNLIAALDPHDSVGVLDHYFPFCNFFTEFERFDRFCDKLQRSGTRIDYLSVCSPNYLHDAHIRFGLRLGADVICEKPVVLNPWNVDALCEMEKETGQKVYPVLQLRHHPELLALKEKIADGKATKKYEVELNYITARGNWYHHSWKGNIDKSGGIATNIGLHFFDMLIWLFGNVQNLNVEVQSKDKLSGSLSLDKAEVKWFLSVDAKDLPKKIQSANQQTWRSLTIDGEEIEFSKGFEHLHTLSYQQVLSGKGVRLEEAKSAIQLVHDIRNQEPGR